MFHLAHISDVHLGPLPHFRKRDMISKRITGYLNWRRNRAKALGNDTLARIIDDIHRMMPDHIAVTGDLVNLSLDAELPAARLWMEALGEPQNVSFVPGNHDAYVIGALDKAVANLADFIADGALVERPFPALRVRGDVAMIGVNSARATPVFVAAGHVSERQIAALKQQLERTGALGLCRVVMIHHPPVRGAISRSKRLYGISRFQKAIGEAGAELILHGHTHVPTLNWIKGPNGKVPVVGVAAASHDIGGNRPAACWNSFEIKKTEIGFSIEMTRRGIQDSAKKIVEIERIKLS